MKTSITVPKSLLDQITDHNQANPARQINRAAVCREALQKALDDQN